ncbi:MAG: cytochrome c [Deltaproteobacteria bacterium]|nr:cytochrome c [Deltaproteobacteria bacterium]
MRPLRFIGVLVALVGLAACPAKEASPDDPPAAKLLGDLAVFAVGKPPPTAELADKAAALKKGTLSIEDYVDELLKQPMGGRLAKDIVLGASTPIKDRHPLPVHSVLRSFGEGADKVYFLRDKCPSADAEKVSAWWGEEVRVCPSAHRPGVHGDGKGRTCGGVMLDPHEVDLCGCGPKLMYCTKNRQHYDDTQDGFQREVVDTAAWIIDGNKPIEQLFTMNESVRTAAGEFMYRRAAVAAGGDADKLLPVGPEFSSKPRLAPRSETIPGQHAGVLSTPSMTYASDALRGVLRNTFDYMWCTGVQSTRVSTESILELKTVDLRVGDGWRDLASMNVCTDCHARLDYGMQFFWGFPSSTAGVDFRPGDARTGKGPLYGKSINDVRGEDDLTPAGFARLVTAQPEFGECMSRRVIDHVFNGTETTADFGAVHETFEKTHVIKQMLKTAMLRFAAREQARQADPKKQKTEPSSSSTLAAAPAGLVHVTPKLRAMMNESCKECHKAGKPYDFSADDLPRRTVIRMIDQVGFGAMPRNAEGLDDDERQAFVRELAGVLYDDAADRGTATAWFEHGVRALPVHRFASAMTAVNARVGKGQKGFRPSAVELATPQSLISYSPAVGVSSAVTAVRGCRDAGHKDQAFKDCVERASSPSAVIVGGLD